MIIYDYFSSVLCIVPKKVMLLKYQKWVSHLNNGYHYAKVVENARISISFSISPYCTLLFSRKENSKFFEVALSAVLCNGAVDCIMNVWGYQHWIPRWTFTSSFKTAIKSLKQGVKICSNLTKCTTAIGFRLTSVFFINLEHLSHPNLVFLFIHWKGKRWQWTFCQNNTVMLTYRHNHAPGILLWQCPCHRNKKQNSEYFFNYDVNLTLVITMELKFIFFLCDVSFSVWLH